MSRDLVDLEWRWRCDDYAVPRHVWNAARHLGVWVEPLTGGKSVRLMLGHSERQGRTLSTE